MTDIIKQHDTSKPFFLYLPLHNVHSPFQAPQEWIDLYPEGSTCEFRRTYIYHIPNKYKEGDEIDYHLTYHSLPLYIDLKPSVGVS